MPISTAPAHKLPPASALTITTGAEALARTRGPVAPGADTADDTAEQVVFDTGDGLRPAWETVVTSSETPATTIIDAVTGAVLLRTPLTQYEHSTGRAYQFFPGSRRGGRQIKVNFTKRGWLGARAHDPERATTPTPTPTSTTTTARQVRGGAPADGPLVGLPAQAVPPQACAKSFCGNPWPCSWNPNKPFSWQRQPGAERHPGLLLRQQLARPPEEGADRLHRGGRQLPAVEPRQARQGRRPGRHPDRRRRRTPTDGLPDGAHIDNANMDTPPDGQSPRMQMYLQHQPGTSYPGRRPVLADQRRRRGRHRLPRVHPRPVQPAGRRRPRSLHARRRPGRRDGRGLERLVRDGLPRRPAACRSDRPDKADVRSSSYDGDGVDLDRTEPIDCKVGAARPGCATAAPPATAAATPTPTTATSSAAPRCTATARSGRRRCGTCATSSARRSPSRW